MGIDRDAISQYPLLRPRPCPPTTRSCRKARCGSDELGNECVGVRPRCAPTSCWTSSGLDKRNDAGIRLLPDGRPMEIVVESSGEDNEQTDVLELVADQWAEIGFKISPKPSDRQIMRSRVYAGSALMSMFFGIDNGVPTAVAAAQRLRADQPGRPAAMAEMGPVLRDQGRGRRAAGPARGQAADGSLQRVDHGERGARDRDLAARCSSIYAEPVLHDRPRLGRAAADRRPRRR